MQQGTDRGCKHAQIRGMNLKKKKKRYIIEIMFSFIF